MKKTARVVRAATVLSIIIALVIGVRLLSATEYTTARANANDLSFYQPSQTTTPYPPSSRQEVHNVIVCIGDGMGLSQIALARVHGAGLAGKLYLERLPVTGLVQTHAANSAVTDSAAAGTALACGIKTNNGMIGMAPDGRAYQTILEAAQAKGMATGIVVTSTLSHATPACFAAHVTSRKMEDQIAGQLLAARVNVLFGGGRKFFLPKSVRHSGRKDEIDLIAAAGRAGYEYVETVDALPSRRGSHVLGLFQLDGLTTAPPEPSLALLTGTALQRLEQVQADLGRAGKGFFLMVEGSQIDWACHDNDVDNVVRQVLLFDQAVQVAVEFAQRDGHTLVLVTADHETGGLALLAGSGADKPPTGLTARWSTKGHSGTPVPLYALGPGASLFAGVQDNTEIPARIARLLQISPFPRAAQ